MRVQLQIGGVGGDVGGGCDDGVGGNDSTSKAEQGEQW